MTPGTRRFDPGRKLVLDLLDPFVDQLSGEVDVGAILEDDGDLAHAISRLRSSAVEMRKPAHGGLDRKRDALFDFQRRVAQRPAIDLDLNVGDIGNGVDRKPREIPGAEGGHAQHADHHKPSLTNGKRKNSINHCASPGVGRFP
jgi:hypothetical protein